MSEHLNGTLIEKSKCMLFDAKLGKEFWAEAVSTAAYLRNTSIATGTGNKTPYELWNDKKPKVGHLRIFGSTVMVHVPKEKRLKWDKKAERKILVGYAENTKGCRVYDPVTKSVSTSRDVVIMEEVETEEITVPVGDKIETPIEEGAQNRNAENAAGPSTENLTENQQSIFSDSEESHEELSKSSDLYSDSDFISEMVIPETETVKKSQRQPKPKDFRDYISYMCTEVGDLSSDPVTVAEVLSRPDKKICYDSGDGII